MTSNRNLDAAWRYHTQTNHSYQSLYGSRRTLDWDNRPIPFKIYSSLQPVPLPRDFEPSHLAALDAIAASEQASGGEQLPDLETLARLCFFSNGVTKHLNRGGPTIAFRAAACTGALYHIELYLVCSDLPGLAAGVYHYGAHDHGLRQLRPGDFRQVLVEATGSEPSLLHAPAAIICTSTFWRNAWKYETRAYRHSFWDNGTMLANLLSVAAARTLPARLVLGFADEAVNQLLDIDPRREAAISMVALGNTAQTPPLAPPVIPLALPTVPLSRREVESPGIYAMHAASSILSGQEAAAWHGTLSKRPFPEAAGPVIPLRPLESANLPAGAVETVIRRRGSTRRFTREPISFEQLSTMLDRATRAIPADFLDPAGGLLSDLYLIVNAVDGLHPGAYVLHRKTKALELLREGDFRPMAGHLALDQDLGADAAVNVYFLCELAPVLERFGNRGYRAAQLAAAIAAGRLYLASYAFRFGATGLTFFDDVVTAFFSTHAPNKSVMFLVALGRPLKRASR